ncbi:hypothetical protein R3P38DRAFT_3028361 [Favolaschia claudopus]|uniref:ABM domain-containing protein n=1 Tax=Favolaschia claudopus TaxID=2862362 RepID=A0AAW0AEA1_9AGAR
MSTVHAVGIYKCPSHLTTAAFAQKVEAVMDAILAAPVTQRHILKYELLVSNEDGDGHIQNLGMPSHQGTVIIVAEWASQKALTEVATDPGLVQILARAKEEFNIHLDSSTFTVDVIRKK